MRHLKNVILPYLSRRINPQPAETVMAHRSKSGYEKNTCCKPVYEHPLVEPQPMHFRQVPLRTIMNRLHS